MNTQLIDHPLSQLQDMIKKVSINLNTTQNSFTVYLTSWGTDKVAQDPTVILQNMISNGVVGSNTRVILAFASFNFTSPDYIPGMNLTIDQIVGMANMAHGVGAHFSLSIGGATYPYYGSDWYGRTSDLANNINQVLSKCKFDGVDFDIEDYFGNVPADFATKAASLINTLRSLNPELYITLTTPAQAWASGCYQQNLLNLTIGNINGWQVMEYDLWVDPSSTYLSQIQWDINYYLNNWGVSPDKLILGLMPGPDDIPRNLSLQDALNLTSFAMALKLKGVMIWDANIDSLGVDGNAPYAYSMGIQSMLNKNKNNLLFRTGIDKKRRAM